jgi:hypothetical protein
MSDVWETNGRCVGKERTIVLILHEPANIAWLRCSEEGEADPQKGFLGRRGGSKRFGSRTAVDRDVEVEHGERRSGHQRIFKTSWGLIKSKPLAS